MKVFGIGANRTGTQSLTMALWTLGYRTSHWNHHEEMMEGVQQNNYNFEFLKEYDAVTDLPVPKIYKELDKTYPGSKFVLTVRDERKWLKSQAAHWEGIKKQNNYEAHKFMYGIHGFDEAKYLEVYRKHNASVEEYFKDREEDLLIMDITEGDGWKELCEFLNKPVPKTAFPYYNKTQFSILDKIIWKLGLVKKS